MIEDSRIVECAASLLARFSARLLAPARPPNAIERSTLRELSKSQGVAMKPGYSEDSCNSLLNRLWRGYFGPNVAPQRFSKKWQQLGFQHGSDPASDVRGGGRLSLECLVYFFETHPGIAGRIVRRQAARRQQRGPFGSYPFACAGIAVCRKLCELFLLVDGRTGHPTPESWLSYTTTYWHCVGSRESFFELFCWCQVQLDRLWDEMGATYMDFPRVIEVAVRHTAEVLHRLPCDVVPSALSVSLRSNEHCDAPWTGEGRLRPLWVLEGIGAECFDGDSEGDINDDGHDEFSGKVVAKSDELEGNEQFAKALGGYEEDQQRGCGCVVATGDLLGMGSEEGSSLEGTSLSSRPNVDFFAEFGLAY